MTNDKKLAYAKRTCVTLGVLAFLSCGLAGALWWAISAHSTAVGEAFEKREIYSRTGSPASQTFGQSSSSMCF